MAAKKSKIPIIVGTISTLAGLKRLARSRSIPCSVVELRLDLIGVGHFPKVIQLLPRIRKLRRPVLPVLITFRSHREGGRIRLADARRFAYISIAIEYADLVDVEASPAGWIKTFRRVSNAPLIISYHNFRTTPPLRRLLKITRGILKNPGSIAKIACRTDKPAQLHILRDLLRRTPRGRVAALGMGDLGPLSRFWLPHQGSVLTYGYLDKSAAPGQVPAEELAKFFRLGQ